MRKTNTQSGQTLIETIVAIFILTTALATGLGLAIYATSQSTKTKDQIVAVNLAREGLEVARMFRDSNWLAAADSTPGVDPLTSCTYPNPNGNGNGGPQRSCYPDAFYKPFADFGTETTATANVNNFRVGADNSTIGWAWDVRNGSENYLLCLQSDGSYQHNDINASGLPCNLGDATARFARRVYVINGSTSAPYTAGSTNNPPSSGASSHSPEKVVYAVVIWQGKGCPVFTSVAANDPLSFVTTCKMTLEEHLTNWKDYD